MSKHAITRRMVLKSSALAAGAAAAGHAFANGKPTKPLTALEESRLHQQEYIAAKLARLTQRSKTVTPKEINDFAAAFTEVHGVVDYRRMFSRIDGEYRLARMFIESVLQVRG